MLEEFKTRLYKYLNFEVDLVINENRSTMLSILERRWGFARISVHKMFLKAPEEVIEALAHHVRGSRKARRQNKLIVRAFIQESLKEGNYTHLVNQSKIEPSGRIYSLDELYKINNEKYFENKLSLSITWYGTQSTRARTRITFGQYLEGLRLIKIHRMLDDPFFPEYFVSFVVYHEMLHAVIPGQKSPGGRFCFHGREFKAREKKYEDYRRAIQWEKENKNHIFRR